MIVVYPFTAVRARLERAAGRVGLEVVQAESFRHGKDFATSEECCAFGFDTSWPTDLILRLLPSYARFCSRTPNEAGVWLLDGQTVLVWDHYKDGFGLSGHLGASGQDLQRAYAVETFQEVCRALAIPYEIELQPDRELHGYAGRDLALQIRADGNVVTERIELLRELLPATLPSSDTSPDPVADV